MHVLVMILLTMAAIGCSTSSKDVTNSPEPSAPTANSSTSKGHDATLSRYNYPFPVSYYSFRAQNQDLRMAYMDVLPAGPAKKTIVLLHGKNFNGAYYVEVAKFLRDRGYRVIIPDQIGFGKSSKPRHYQFTFQELAVHTYALLNTLETNKISLWGHSMGGMLATRFALMYPEKVEKLYLVNPIGLEDWKTMTSYRTIDQNYLSELTNTAEKLKAYQLENYYDNQWSPSYEQWLEPLVGWQIGPDAELMAWISALTSDMIFTQPVVYEFKNLKMPTVLILGQRDRTALGKAWAPAEMKKKMGNYPQLGRKVKAMIPKSQLIELPGLGHLPFIEAPETFWKAVEKEF